MKKSYLIVLIAGVFLFLLIAGIEIYNDEKKSYSPNEGIGYGEARRQCLSGQEGAACYTLSNGYQCVCKYSSTQEKFNFFCCSGDEHCSMEPEECKAQKDVFGREMTAPCCIFELPGR